MSFIKKFTSGEKQERQQNEQLILQTQEKMNQLVRSVDGELQTHKNLRERLYAQVGEQIYQMSKKGSLPEEISVDLEELFGEIAKNEELSRELENKISAIRGRYQEELEILKKFQPGSPAGESSGGPHCTNCGFRVNIGDIFCINCGQKL